MKRVLITGAYGQDGYYLIERLFNNKNKIYGLVRKKNNKNFINKKINLIEFEIGKSQNFADIIKKGNFDFIYHLAAYSSGSGMNKDPDKILSTNGIFTHEILEAVKKHSPKTKLFLASSSEIFGNTNTKFQNENTPLSPRSIYGAAKILSLNLAKIYRERYNLFISNGILYNHESIRRPINFITRKITHESAKIKLGLSNKLVLENMHSKRDWGHSIDYVKAMEKIINYDFPTDFIISTGITHSVKDICKIAFKVLKLDYKKYVSINNNSDRTPDKGILRGNNKKIKDTLKWKPKISFETMIKEMTLNDLELLKKK